MLRGLGRTVSRDAVRAWVVLHRYVHLARMLEACGEAFEPWLDSVWQLEDFREGT